jgi:hypothetical protein
MTITYRTTGAWGVGTGFDLPAATIDANFWDLHGRVDILEAWPTPAAIEEFIIDGNQLTVVMDDATTFGPYTLPTYVPSAFVWEPGIDVVPGQMFSMNATIYTVIYPHTTVDPFDPDESAGTDGPYYQEFITVDGVLPAGGAEGMALVKSTSADYDVTWSFAVIPAGGTTGQHLGKVSDTDYDVDWVDNDLDGLSDVTISAAAEGDVLQYVGTDGWQNGPITVAADDVSFTSSTDISATDVQAAIEEVYAASDPAALALKANIASPTLTGTPAAPTAAADTNTTQIATTAYVQAELADRARLDLEDQTLTGGARVTSKSLGTVTTGTTTPDPGDRPMQHYTNGGAHTLAPGANPGSYFLDITNNGSAGVITTSGWTKVSGDSFTTTNGHLFRCSCSIGNAGSLLNVQAMQ